MPDLDPMKRRRTVRIERKCFVSSSHQQGPPVSPPPPKPAPGSKGSGRPRSTRRSSGCCRARYDKLTFDAVAAEVRASKATLYRNCRATPPLSSRPSSRRSVRRTRRPGTGALRGDLLLAAARTVASPRAFPPCSPPSSGAAPRRGCPGVESRFLGPMRPAVVGTFRRAQQRGEVGPDADLERLADPAGDGRAPGGRLRRDCGVADVMRSSTTSSSPRVRRPR